MTVREVAARYGVGQHTVLSWIRSGELRAIDVSTRAGAKRPTWRITAASVEAFEALRARTPPPPKVGRRKKAAGEIIEFIR